MRQHAVARPLLLDGSDHDPTLVGLQLRDGELLYYSAEAPPGASEGPAILRIGAEGIEAHGRVQPFTAVHFDELGSLLMASEREVPADAADIANTMAWLQEQALERCGTKLPLDPEGVDQLYSSLGQQLAPHGRSVLALLTAQSLLDRGWRWQQNTNGVALWTDWLVRSQEVRDNAFATGATVSWLLCSTLDDSEGLYSPVRTSLDAANGRSGHLGLDSRVVDGVIEATLPSDLEKMLAQSDAEQWSALLQEHASNPELRVRLYAFLEGAGRCELLIRLSEPFAKAEKPLSVDVTAWLLARANEVGTPDAAEELAREVFAALPADRWNGRLYLALGELYEKARPDEPRYARSCYEQLLEVQRWGDVANTARAALDRLAGQ